MKKSLLNRMLLATILLTLIFPFSRCTNQTKSISGTKQGKVVQEIGAKNQAISGELTGSAQTNAVGAKYDTLNRIVVIKHNAPNQSKIDSVKKEKSKEKK